MAVPRLLALRLHAEGAAFAAPSFRSYRRLVRQRIGPQLEVRRQRPSPLAAFDQPWRPIAIRRPQTTAFPAGVRIIDAAVEALGIEALRVRHADRDHLAVLYRDQTIHEVGGRHRNVFAKPEG